MPGQLFWSVILLFLYILPYSSNRRVFLSTLVGIALLISCSLVIAEPSSEKIIQVRNQPLSKPGIEVPTTQVLTTNIPSTSKPTEVISTAIGPVSPVESKTSASINADIVKSSVPLPVFNSTGSNDVVSKSVATNTPSNTLRTFGIWVEAEGPSQPLNDGLELSKLEDLIRTGNISDLYVQVYRHGRSWFPSKIADDTPYRKMKDQGIDPLGRIIKAAKEHVPEVKVHLWFNALRLGHDTDSKVLKTLGKEAVLVSSRGESLFDNHGYGRIGCRPDTPGIWLDSDNKKVAALLLNLFLEVYSKYPEVKGLHLDMIRNPFPYSGTGEPMDSRCVKFMSPRNFDKMSLTRARLNEVPEAEDDTAKVFEKISGPSLVVKKFRRVLKRVFPGVELSAAVLSNQTKA